MTDNKYRIITNKAKRNILVVNDVVDVDRVPDLEFEDFDAIYVNVIDSVRDRVMLALRLASPLLSEKCRFKPCYVTRRLKGWLGSAEVMTDGYAVSPDDAVMQQGIEDIYSNMRRINFLLGTPPVATHAEEVIRLCRYAISRGNYTFSSHTTPGLNSGYMALYHYTLWNVNQECMQQQEREYFMDKMLALGYIRRRRFLEKIHLCPHCRRPGLLFFESCPKCGSSDLSSEHMIHHFRCAHVAPESSFMADGELVCPKCRHTLRHIGVDYDKPSMVNTCRGCGDTFMFSDMRVTCAHCRRSMTTADLVPHDVVEYEFTPDGIRAFASNDVQYTIPQTGFFGYSSMRDFTDYISRIYGAPDRDDCLLVARFRIDDPSASGSVLPAAHAVKRLYSYKSAMRGNDFFFLCRAPAGRLAKALDNMVYELRNEFEDYADANPGFTYELASTHICHPDEDVADFINLATA